MSKVAMSICAIMLMAVTGGVVENALQTDESSELLEILCSFDRLLSDTRLSGPGCHLSWVVPGTSEGAGIVLELSVNEIAAQDGSGKCSLELTGHIHTWAWDGEPLCHTDIEEHDLASATLEVASGDRLSIKTDMVPVDDVPTMMMFVAAIILPYESSLPGL